MARVAQSLILLALIGGAWWIGARSPLAQMSVLALSALALLAAAISTSLGGIPSSRITRSAIVAVGLMLIFLAIQAFRIGNPSFAVQMSGETWRLIPLPNNSLVPAGYNAPFDGLSEGKPAFTNPLRHLIIFGAAFCATVAAFLVSRREEIRRGIMWTLVVQAALFSIVSIAHRLSGAREVLWFYTDPEFWMGSPVFPYKNTAAAYQVLLIGACLAAFRSVRDRAGKKTALLWLTGIVAGLALLALLLLNCRAGVIMGFLLAVLFIQKEWLARGSTGAPKPRRILAVVGIGILLVCGGGVLALGGFGTTLKRFDSEIRNPITLLRGGKPRIQKQNIAIEMTKDRPWFGWGGGAYLPLFLTYHQRTPEFLRDLLIEQPGVSRIQQTSADGDWWEFSVEYGIIGVILLLGSMALGGWMWLRLHGPQCPASLYLMASAGLVALHGIIDQILRDEIVLATLGVTFALAIRTAQAHQPAATVSRPRRR